MQGTFQDIDIRELLQLIELGQRTGELYIEADPNRAGRETLSRSWFLFFINGRIAYAVERSDGPLDRLRDYLYPAGIEIRDGGRGPEGSSDSPELEYTRLWWLITEKELSPFQARAILEAMIRETLFDLFGLRRGAFVFRGGPAIAPALLSLPLSPLLPEIARQTRQWRAFSPLIRQAEQSISISRDSELKAALPEKAYRNLAGWARQKTTLRQLSRYLRRDMATIARNLYPYAQRGWLSLSDSPDGTVVGGDGGTIGTGRGEVPRIVTMGKTLGEKIGSLLAGVRCRHTELNGSPEAWNSLVAIEPAAIVCEIAAAPLDGYELCRLLRGSRPFRSTPILLVAGIGEEIDRRRARMVGATDSLNEPFGKEEFLSSLARHLPLDRSSGETEKFAPR
ncbi:response regulator [Pannus brasiliensis CCIBt3594]|uniref:Response regulator n=1 Tax=Pannus brasiliensis CCIBt3594 TaxID=1427578 RepID=A0AAW9QTB2_9CHRO